MEQALADLVGPDLRVLFCGINPGTLSGELGLHFARTGNRFWKLLHAGGFTESVLPPAEQHILPAIGIGITNLVGRVTAAASELSSSELREGATQLEAKVEILRPRCVAVLGMQEQESDRSPNPSALPFFGSSPTRAASRPATKSPR
jgi:TDG/mug DNA glycosylase family protein